MDIRNFLDRCFRRYPEKTALVDRKGKTYSFQELHEEIKAASAGLKNLGLRAGDTVALMTDNEVNAFTILLASWFSGITVAEIKPKTSPENISYFLEDSEADAFFYSERSSEKVGEAKGIDIEFMRSIEAFEKGNPAKRINPDEELNGEIARLGYTSGTTGLPKGVPFTHERLLHHVYVLLMRQEVTEGDRICLIYPYYGVGSLELLAGLSSGATLYLPEDNSSESTLETIEEKDITTIGGVPTQLKGLAENADGYDTSSLRYLHTGSGVLTEKVYNMIKEQLCEKVCTSYGSSEAGETLYSLEDSISIGRPTRFQRVRLVKEGEKDPEKIIEGEGSGELIVKADGPGVFDGYWNKPEKTDEVLIDGWYFTGDVVYRDTRGMYWFRGRDDDMIISGGENISPVAIENMLLTHSEVENTGVVGIKDEKWGEKVVAFVKSGSELNEGELDQHCRESDLENFKRPKDYVFVDELPLNKTGGVERKKLRDRR